MPHSDPPRPCSLPQTLQKEIQGHEPRVEELLGRRAGLARCGPVERVEELQEAWRELGHQAELRHQRLERAHAAQQFYFDVAEAEAWMGEQELHMMSQEKAKVWGKGSGGPAPTPPWEPGVPLHPLGAPPLQLLCTMSQEKAKVYGGHRAQPAPTPLCL